MFKKMTFQPTLSDSEDQEIERMVNRARITTAAQFYDRDEKEGLTEIGAENDPPAKKMHITQSSIPYWSKESLGQHVKKVEKNLELIQQGKGEDAEVFVRNNTHQRDGLNMVSKMLEGHLQKIANITLKQMPSQAMELLGTELVNTGETVGEGKAGQEPTSNQMESDQGKQCQEKPEVDVQMV